MIEIADVALGLAAGLVMGGVYFGGLWLTVRRLHGARRPGLLTAVSFFARTALAAGGFYIVARLGGLPEILAALAGFVGVRIATVSITKGRQQQTAPGGPS